ncbi:zinc-ribbon domain-containing protein [Fluviibacterium sp. DFM31]|uniref:Zinc-ribbon domain-containing protein n=1 Tax=Meridianimarinicoccus marinus TaxID=3231483 RepID=A0ABV3L2G4_9RHOB
MSEHMRIICPDCQAKYDIPDAAIPDAGREVQCARCAHAWYQLPLTGAAAGAVPRDLARDDGEDEDTPPPEATARQDTETGAPSPRRELDPSLLSVLREEAKREAAVRAGKEEILPPAAATPEPAAPSGASARLARLKAAETSGTPLTPDTEAAVEDPGAATRSPQPPLLTASEATAKPARPGRDLPVPISSTELAVIAQRRLRTGFRLGFGLTAGLACLAVGVYLAAPHVAAILPQGTPYADLVIAHGNRVQAQLIEALSQLLAPRSAL